MAKVVRITLGYYDKTYQYGLAKREPATITKIVFEKWDTGEMVEGVMMKNEERDESKL